MLIILLRSPSPVTSAENFQNQDRGFLCTNMHITGINDAADSSFNYIKKMLIGNKLKNGKKIDLPQHDQRLRQSSKRGRPAGYRRRHSERNVKDEIC